MAWSRRILKQTLRTARKPVPIAALPQAESFGGQAGCVLGETIASVSDITQNAPAILVR
jgi:hypothetical protein